MKKLRLLFVAAGIMASAQTFAQNILQGTITSNQTLTSDKVWTLKGYVKVDSNVTLTIQPGTIIKSDVSDKGALIITRGGKIMAEGTANAPIVFTSGKAEGDRRPGDWGGIVILGSAPTNRSTPPTIEGGISEVYGGTNANDNSGVMRYCIIEFAGIAAAPGSEINGLTLGGVGKGTTLEYIMVAYGNDDAFEFFGGNVNAKHLIAFATADDDFDFDFGYTGKIQYAIAFRDPSFVDAGDAGNGIECDNDGSGSTATPFTRPVLSNFTFAGAVANASNTPAANHNLSNRWRRSARFVIANSIVGGYPKGGFSLESFATGEAYKNGDAMFKNNILHAPTAVFKFDTSAARGFNGTTDASAAATAAQTKATGTDACTIAASYADIKLTDVANLNAPNFTPAAGSPALTGASFAGTDLSDAFFTSGDFRGAIGTTNWLAGWTNFDPINKATENIVISSTRNTKAVSGVNVYPNPINANSKIEFAVEKAGNYVVTLVDITGKVVATLHNGALATGINTLNLNNTNLNAGMYFVNFVGNNGTSTVKVQVL